MFLHSGKGYFLESSIVHLAKVMKVLIFFHLKMAKLSLVFCNLVEKSKILAKYLVHFTTLIT